jgi:hypothetical protein
MQISNTAVLHFLAWGNQGNNGARNAKDVTEYKYLDVTHKMKVVGQYI